MLASSAMGSMADLVAEDLAPLGALAGRATAYPCSKRSSVRDIAGDGTGFDAAWESKVR